MKDQKTTFGKTLKVQAITSLFLFAACVVIRITGYSKCTDAVKAILTVQTDIPKVLESIYSRFTEENALETVSPVSCMEAPSSGEIVRGFGAQDAQKSGFHYGVILSCNPQENILAASGGVVTEIATNQEYGTFAVVRHSEEITTLYGKLNEVFPDVGAEVSQGQPIGRAGGENNTFYFELKRGETYLDPTEFISFGEKNHD